MSEAAQKRVFTKWIMLNLSQSDYDESNLNEDNLVDSFQDGELLLRLVEVLSETKSSAKKPKSDNKLQVMGYLTEVLKFVEKQNIRLTLSAENIYEKDQTMVLGLIWLLILKYQVGKKQEILKWLRILLEGETISNFEADWKNGILFSKLVNALTGVDNPIEDDIKKRLEYAFTTADSKLGIKEIIAPEDIVGGFFDERSCLTYLSFFYNKYKHIGGKVVQDDRIPSLEARIKELELICQKKEELLNKSQADVQKILKNTKTLYAELKAQKEANDEISQTVEELQLKLPFLQQKAATNDMPPPSGSDVSVVVVDVEDAETLWNEDPNNMALALQLLQASVRSIGKRHKAFEAEIVNEKMTYAFSDAIEALAFAIEIQESLNNNEDWPEVFLNDKDDLLKGLPTVIALHTGTCAYVDGKYSGPAVRVINRLICACRGGEILSTESSWDNVLENDLPEDLKENIAKNELGNFEVKEIGKPIDVIQLFPSNLKNRSSLYKEFEFLTPDEKQQNELKDKLAKLKEDNDNLKVKLEATEAQAKKARDRALELNKWLNESRNELRTTVGDQIQAAMAEVATLIRESEQLESDLSNTTKQLDGARKVMGSMNTKLQNMSQKNNLLSSQVSELENEQNQLHARIEQLENEINSKKKGFISKILGKSKSEKKLPDPKKPQTNTKKSLPKQDDPKLSKNKSKSKLRESSKIKNNDKIDNKSDSKKKKKKKKKK